VFYDSDYHLKLFHCSVDHYQVSTLHFAEFTEKNPHKITEVTIWNLLFTASSYSHRTCLESS